MYSFTDNCTDAGAAHTAGKIKALNAATTSTCNCAYMIARKYLRSPHGRLLGRDLDQASTARHHEAQISGFVVGERQILAYSCELAVDKPSAGVRDLHVFISARYAGLAAQCRELAMLQSSAYVCVCVCMET